LKRVEVIEDDEAEIIEAVRRMSERYDFVVTRYVALVTQKGLLVLTRRKRRHRTNVREIFPAQFSATELTYNQT
jgi:hypothetical protein